MNRSARSVTNTLNAATGGASLPTPSSCRICCWGLKRDFPPLLGGELRPYRCIYYGRRRPLSNCSAGLIGVCCYPIRYPEGSFTLMLLVKSLILWRARRDSNS
jgi:hypothetical protein